MHSRSFYREPTEFTLKTLLLIIQVAVERLYNPALSPEFSEQNEGNLFSHT